MRWEDAKPVRGPLDDRDAAGYADLRSYAVIGDGRTVALIARDARIDWLPMPDLDAVPAYAALLDAEHGGYIALQPDPDRHANVEVSRRYLPDTNVCETTFHTAEGEARITDALTTGVAGRLPWCELARRIDGVSGTVYLRAVVAPGTLLNTATPWICDTVHGTVLRLGDLTMAVRTLHDDGVEITPRTITATYTTAPGSRHLLGLASTADEPLQLPDPGEIDRDLDRTIDNWRTWSETFAYDGPWTNAVRRSALTLKQLVFAPTGAVAAAATTSLPESDTKEKNWDYRFSWVRDTAFALTALIQFGVREETHAAISHLLANLRRHTDTLGVLQTLDGAHPGDAVHRYDVPGWRGHRPVVAGNPAGEQLQLGVYGDIFNVVQLYVDSGNVLDERTSRLLTGVANKAADHWLRRDAGIWELPEQRHYTTSKLGCWQALQHAVHLGEVGQIDGDLDRWRHEQDAIADWVGEHCWSDAAGAYTFYPGTQRLDASILLHAISGFDRGERMVSTIAALQRELGAGPHLYRYSGAAKEEYAFVACSFWQVAALALVGDTERARTLMDELVGDANDVGIWAEMIDPETGEFWGNLPQALSHLAVVNAALTLQ